MTAESDALVLEIQQQDEQLTMSIYGQQELASTVRHYSQRPVSARQTLRLCQEVALILNKASEPGYSEAELNDRLKKAGQLLWEELLTPPVKDRLKVTIIKNLILSLDEGLISIPWEFLYDGKDFLCLKFSLGRLIKTHQQNLTLRYRSSNTAALKVLILADPTNDLKSAYAEGIYIKGQFDRRREEIKIDFKSTSIDTFYVKKNLRDYDIVHFAGHCEYDHLNPQDSGWVFSDGRFTARDIITLASSTPLPALVFSNACSSARVVEEKMCSDYQEKTYSLASAFLFSGVRHYIGTIRKVAESPSLVFAQEFYSQLIKGGSVGECVRQARLRLLKESRDVALPWANYLLYGDPNLVLLRPKIRPLIPKFRREVSWIRRRFLHLALVVSALAAVTWLYLWIPNIRPDTYFLFLKSSRLFAAGKNQEVVSLGNRVLAQDPRFLPLYPLLAQAYQRLGDAKGALKYYFEYALQSERRNDKRNLASAYIGIGWFFHQRGDYTRSADFYHQALAVSQKNGDQLNEAVALRKLAVWQIDKGRYDQALALLTKSSEINRERARSWEHRYNLACDYFNLGLLFINQDDFAAARQFYQKSAALFEKLKLKWELSDYWFNLGEVYVFQKQYHKALDCYQRGIKIDQEQANLPNLASDYNMLGELYLEMGSLEEAQVYFERSVGIARKIDAPLELAGAYYNLGLLYKQKNIPHKAQEYLQLAQGLYCRTEASECQEVKEEIRNLP